MQCNDDAYNIGMISCRIVCQNTQDTQMYCIQNNRQEKAPSIDW